LAGPALILMRGTLALDTYELAGRRDSMVGVWLDSALRALGLKPASGATLPYTIPFHPVARGSVYNFSGESEAFAELAHWLTAAADLLEGMRQEYPAAQPDAVRCWPHHFDIATVMTFGADAGAAARSIGVGVSLGDHYYAQPYVYVSPTPHPAASPLPEVPPGHWHTHGFFGAVATGEQILSLADRRAGTFDFVRRACEISGTHGDPVTQEAGDMNNQNSAPEQREQPRDG